MPPTDRTGSHIDVASIVESILDRVDISAEAKAEIVALAKEWRILMGCRVNSIQTTADLTRILTRNQYREMNGFPQVAAFHFPPNNPKFEAELKRLQAEEKSFEIIFLQGHREEDTQIHSISVSSIY